MLDSGVACCQMSRVGVALGVLLLVSLNHLHIRTVGQHTTDRRRHHTHRLMLAIAVPVQDFNANGSVEVAIAQSSHGDLGLSPLRTQSVVNLTALPDNGVTAVFIASFSDNIHYQLKESYSGITYLDTSMKGSEVPKNPSLLASLFPEKVTTKRSRVLETASPRTTT